MPRWFDLYTSCPICYTADNKCTRGEKCYWKHKDCSGGIQISENVDLQCDYCEKPSSILNWLFFCSKHGKYEGIKKGLKLKRALTLIADSMNITDDIQEKMFDTAVSLK